MTRSTNKLLPSLLAALVLVILSPCNYCFADILSAQNSANHACCAENDSSQSSSTCEGCVEAVCAKDIAADNMTVATGDGYEITPALILTSNSGLVSAAVAKTDDLKNQRDLHLKLCRFLI